MLFFHKMPALFRAQNGSFLGMNQDCVVKTTAVHRTHLHWLQKPESMLNEGQYQNINTLVWALEGGFLRAEGWLSQETKHLFYDTVKNFLTCWNTYDVGQQMITLHKIVLF